jgi:hypothetical protein
MIPSFLLRTNPPTGFGALHPLSDFAQNLRCFSEAEAFPGSSFVSDAEFYSAKQKMRSIGQIKSSKAQAQFRHSIHDRNDRGEISDL